MFESGDIIPAERPGRNSFDLEIRESEKLKKGAEDKERLTLVALRRDSPEGRELKMVIKKVDNLGGFNRSRNVGKADSEIYYKNWLMLKKAGIPTIPTVRIVDKDRVLLTDMTSDGGTFLGKESTVYEFDPLNPSEAQIAFTKLDLAEVIKEAERVERLSYEKMVRLPNDDPFELLVHPDGKWEVIVLDPGMAEDNRGRYIPHMDSLNDSRYLASRLKNLQEGYLKKINDNRNIGSRD